MLRCRFTHAPQAGRSRRSAPRMRELTVPNGWPPSLRAANQPLDRQNPPHNQAPRAHYAEGSAGQLAHYESKATIQTVINF